ncbi:hypothetical protein M433DRAFT_961 [Acidomyces richmondensis BFW]|nr:MAG: hypothetical protein FE78DRAFT_33506 [Acidomyces sp. 'richmondensis']KYG49657.1 hypothetical protein M433DRAFT_961 [Acidomyces richmondensis BFW]
MSDHLFHPQQISATAYPATYVPSSGYTNPQCLQPSQQQQQQGHKSRYPCLFLGCQGNSSDEAVVFSRAADLRRHIHIVHNRESLELINCEVPGCLRKGLNGFTRKDKMIDHMREVHKKNIPKRIVGPKVS